MPEKGEALMEKIKIGDLQAEQGAKEFGFLKVGQTSTSSIDLPIMIINGLKEGPTLALTAGIHGCEYSGIEAAIRIFNFIDAKKLSGAIIVAPVVNTPAFQARTPYVCPIDGVNLNRIFPGDPTGSISYKIAHAVFDNVVSKANFLIDLHGADLPEELPPLGLTLLKNVGNEKVDQMSENLANLFNAGYILVSKIKGTCIGEAAKIGIPAVGPEAGGGAAGKIEEWAVTFYTKGILNAMKYMKMIEGTLEKTRTQEKIVGVYTIRTKLGGIFYPKKKAGNKVSKGEIIGEVKNLRGSVIEEITASISGIVLIRMTYVTVNSSDVVMMLGELEG